MKSIAMLLICTGLLGCGMVSPIEEPKPKVVVPPCLDPSLQISMVTTENAAQDGSIFGPVAPWDFPVDGDFSRNETWDTYQSWLSFYVKEGCRPKADVALTFTYAYAHPLGYDLVCPQPRMEYGPAVADENVVPTDKLGTARYFPLVKLKRLSDSYYQAAELTVEVLGHPETEIKLHFGHPDCLTQ